MSNNPEPLAPEIVALIEKIDTLDRADSSYRRAKELTEIGQLTDAERKALADALNRVARRETLVEAMRIVINDNDDEVTMDYDNMTITPSKMLVNRSQLEIIKKFVSAPANAILPEKAVR
jgi:hypothetical protein